MKRLNYFELDLPRCGNVAGVAPCTATETGDAKCFNSRATCNDLANFRLETPDVDFVRTTEFDTDTTTHNVNMPFVVGAGDLLLAIFANDGSATVTTPAGWELLGTQAHSAIVRGSVYAKVADGTEAGTTVNFITSATEAAAAQVFIVLANRWSGAIDPSSTGVAISALAAATSVIPDPPALVPPWGEATNLWIAAAIESNTVSKVDTPSGFGNYLHSDGGSGVNGAEIHSVYTIAKKSDIDPGPFEFTATIVTVLFTIAIQPKSETSLRFCTATMYQPKSIEAYPNMLTMDHAPQLVSLGENLGERSNLKVTFEDTPHSDTGPGYDPYLSERTYNPYLQGTHWGKFRNRHAFIQGTTCRMIRGIDNQPLAAMDIKHLVVETLSGPSVDHKFEITAKDILKFLDGDKAQAPYVGSATVSEPLDASENGIDLAPAGIGDEEFDLTGYVCIGGKEVCGYNRSAGSDVLSVGRGLLGTTATTHDSGVRAQNVLWFEGVDVADILHTLLVTYGGVPAHLIPLSSWRSETVAFLNRLYTGYVTEPTSVKKLCAEIIEQAALAVWQSDSPYQINLQVLRAVASSAAAIDESMIQRGSLQITERTDKRLSEVWTFYNQRDKTRPLDEESNYGSVLATIDSDATADYAVSAIKKIFSRWIPTGGEATAERLNDLLLAQYRRAPRRFQFSLFPDNPISPVLGNGYRISVPQIQDQNGVKDSVPVICVSVKSEPDSLVVTADELQLGASVSDIDGNVIHLNSDDMNVDLLTLHNQLYNEAVSGTNVYCFISTGVIIGSVDRGTSAFVIDGFADGVNIYLIISGRIQGAGADGSNGGAAPNGDSGQHGDSGGDALLVRNPTNVDASQGQIWSGGGGGGGGGGGRTSSGGARSGGGGGGGGAGIIPGEGGSGGDGAAGGGRGNRGDNAGITDGGDGGNGGTEGTNGGDGGNGGDPGEDGQDGEDGSGDQGGNGGNGGDRGQATDGDSFITYGVFDSGTETFTPGATGTEDIRGAEVG